MITITSKTVQFGVPPVVLSAKNDIINCPITSCSLMTADCSAVYTAPDLSISPTGNLDVSLSTT